MEYLFHYYPTPRLSLWEQGKDSSDCMTEQLKVTFLLKYGKLDNLHDKMWKLG